MAEVSRRTTSQTLAQLGRVVDRHFSEEPVQSRELLLALLLVETADGKAVQNNNVGNLSAGGFNGGVERISWSGDYWRPPWFYGQPAETAARMLAGKAPSAFRAYPTIDAGAADWAAMMRRTFGSIIAASRSGSVVDFVVACKAYAPEYGPSHVATFEKKLAAIRQSKALRSDGASRLTTGLVITGIVGTLVGIGWGMFRRRKEARHGNGP